MKPGNPHGHRCRTCWNCEPTGEGMRGGETVDTGICRGDVPKINVASAGVFPPVTLDQDWCARHPKLMQARKRGAGNA